MVRHTKQTASVAVLVLLATAWVPGPAFAEPPPWAPAHGWRKKNDPDYVGYTGRRWERDYGVLGGRCNTAAVGAALGGAVGGVVGSRAGSEGNRPVAIILGTVLGAVIGAKIGRELDEGDRACMGHALELAGEKRVVSWSNASTGVAYQLTPQRGHKHDGLPCRDFTTRIVSDGRSELVRGTACRRGEGVWEFRS